MNTLNKLWYKLKLRHKELRKDFHLYKTLSYIECENRYVHKPNDKWLVVTYCFYELKDKYDVWMCKHFGHKYVDESVANSEYGTIDLRCKRCGWGIRKYIY